MTGLFIEGTINRVETYGLYLDTPEGPAIVLIPDVSETPIPDLRAAYSPGQKVPLRLLVFVPEYGLYKGTMIRGD